MIRFTCNNCHHEIENNYPVCNECSQQEQIKDIKEVVQGKIDEIKNLAETLNIGEAYIGEMRAYMIVLHTLDQL